MTRRWLTVGTVVLAILVATAAAAAASNPVPISQHTTDSDFQGATTLSGATINGTGTSAFINALFDGNYSLVDDVGDGQTESSGQSAFAGDTGLGDPIKTQVEMDVTRRGVMDKLTVDVHAAYNSQPSPINIYLVEEGIDNTYGEGKLIKQDWQPSWSSGLKTIDVTNTTLSAETYTLEFVTESSDNDGDPDRLFMEIDDSPSSVHWKSIYGSQEIYGDVGINFAPQPEQRYISPNHSVGNAAVGKTNLTLQNASATVRWEYESSGSWNTGPTQTYTSSGNKSADLSAYDGDAWRANVTFAYKNGTTQAQLHDDTVLFNATAPSASNAAPFQQLSAEPSSLSVSVNDSDFPLPQGDTVDISFDLDGSSAGSTTVSSNGTASIAMPSRGQTGGDHTVTATLTDDYGFQDSVSYTYQVPANLTIRPERKPSELVNNTTVNLTFYYESGGVQTGTSKTTTDGTVNLTGLPVDQPIVATADADGYYQRRIFINGIYDQQSVYLLNDSATATKTIFNLRDFTGDYPQDVSALKVQRLINGTWSTVLGDYFGANGQFPGQLEYNTRHRLVIVNTETNQSRILGTYTPLTDSQEAISISPTGNITQQALNASFSVEPAAQLFPAEQISITPSLDAGATTISSWNTTAYLVTNNSITTLFTRQESSAGNFTETINLTGHANATVRIETEWTTASGYTQTRSLTYGIVPQSKAPSLIGNLNQLTTQVPQEDRDAFTTAIAIVVSLVATAAAGGALRLPGEASGFVGAMFVTGFGILGWVGYDLVFVVLVAWGALAFLGRRY